MQQIAVVDGDPLICNLVDNAFSDFGAVVRCATTGGSGRRLLISLHFDVALIEVVLPDASGFALAEIAANENTPVLLMSGRPTATARAGQFDLDCLPKPFDLLQLRAAAELVMAEHRRNVERIKDGMARYRANLLGLADMKAETGRLIGESRHILAKAAAQLPKQG